MFHNNEIFSDFQQNSNLNLLHTLIKYKRAYHLNIYINIYSFSRHFFLIQNTYHWGKNSS